jgi:hypothetical protein
MFGFDRIPMTESSPAEAVTLGTWIGREQAFNALAHHCSAARAACLKQVRDTEAYKHLNLTWDQFCPEHAGISRMQADRLIRQLDEFGAPYFQLTDIVPVSPATYREIEPSIADGAIEFRGEYIPIARENASKIKAAVHALRKEVDRVAEQAAARTIPSITSLQARFDVCFEDLNTLLNRAADPLAKASLRGLFTYCSSKLARFSRRFPPPPDDPPPS